jgi:hypothetical protein
MHYTTSRLINLTLLVHDIACSRAYPTKKIFVHSSTDQMLLCERYYSSICTVIQISLGTDHRSSPLLVGSSMREVHYSSYDFLNTRNIYPLSYRDKYMDNLSSLFPNVDIHSFHRSPIYGNLIILVSKLAHILDNLSLCRKMALYL